MEQHDAVVVGAGPNGLVAANLLVDAGWDVLVLEAQDEPGGAVRTAEVTAPGFRNDLFSAFYPLAAGSGVIGRLGLEDHGLRWSHAPAVVGGPTIEGPAAVLHRKVEDTTASLERLGPGDGEAWSEMYRQWEKVGPSLVEALLSPFPPVRGALKLAAVVGPRRLADFARFALLPVRRMADEHFAGPGGGLLLAGNALHSDLAPEVNLSGLFGWMLAMLGQQVGFPVPEGGAGELSGALARRFEARGGTLRCGAPVRQVVVEGGRATGVEVGPGATGLTGAGSGPTGSGAGGAGAGSVAGTAATGDRDRVGARRAVLADVDGEVLLRRLVAPEHLSSTALTRLLHYQRGWPTVKVDWALSRPIPWLDREVAWAGTVHLASSMDELTLGVAELAAGRLPTDPFLVIGQMTTSDPSRSPAGTESAWAYTHVPATIRDEPGLGSRGRPLQAADVAEVVRRMEARIERFAPGFHDLVMARNVLGPAGMEAANANLVAGDIGGGTYQLHQQLVFRPWPGLARAETPVRGLYLASSSAHPGGGVHGACGANAARAALLHARLRRT